MSVELRTQLLRLERAANASVELVGGKAHGLGLLFERGFRVPNGFVVPANVGLSGARPDDFEEAIARVVAKRTGVRFAVRSSASAEDSQNASWAGQFETVLEVSPERVWEAVAV